MPCDDVCRIIEACAKASVRKLTFRGLHLEFGSVGTAILPEPLLVTEPPRPSEAALSEMHDKQNAEALVSDELRLREEQIANMVVENPLLAEQLIADGEIFEEDENGDDDEQD